MSEATIPSEGKILAQPTHLTDHVVLLERTNKRLEGELEEVKKAQRKQREDHDKLHTWFRALEQRVIRSERGEPTAFEELEKRVTALGLQVRRHEEELEAINPPD